MSAVWTRVRAELRSRLTGIVVLAVLVSVAGGAALTAFAGARRADSAVDRFLAYSRAADANVGAFKPGVLERLLQLPQVRDSVTGAFMLMAPIDDEGRVMREHALSAFSAVGGAYGTIGRPKLLAGRVPDRDAAHEALLNASAAAATGLGVGDRVRMRGWTPERADEVLRGSDAPPNGPIVDLHIVGVGRLPSELGAIQTQDDVIYVGSNFVLLTPGFFAEYGDTIATGGGTGAAVRFVHGPSDLPAYEAAVHKVTDEAFVDGNTDDRLAGALAGDATRLEALALVLFGLLATLVAVAFVAQTMARQAFVDGAEYPALGAMGMTRGQLIGVAVIRAAVVGVAGALGAVAIAYLLSPRMPIGLARQAEVDPGYSFDGRVLGGGALVIVTFVVAAAALAAWRTARSVAPAGRRVASGIEHPSRLVAGLARAGVSPSAVVGVRMAVEPGRGPTAVPVRTTLVSAAVAVAVLAGTLTFGASLHHLATTPVLHGWNWDVAVGNPHSEDVSETAIPLLDKNPDVAGFTAIAGPGDLSVGGHAVALVGMDTVKGSVFPPILEGRRPEGPDEIAIAARDLKRVGRSVGEDVTVAAPTGDRRMRIVGRMVLTPSVVNGQIHIGDGAIVTMDAFRAMAGAGESEDEENVVENVFAVRLENGVDRAAALRRLRHDFPGTVLSALRPTDVENLRRVSALPSVLAGLFATVALLTVGHMLVSSVRRRRRDVAILRTMGFVRRQVSAAVAWQATTVVLVGLLVGVPVGVASGRWTWSLVADALGVRFAPVVPALVVVLIVVGSLVLANALASLPALMAARTRPAEALRTE